MALQAGDPVNVAYWRRMVRVSEAMFRQVYARLSVDPRLELCGESFYNDKIPAGEAAPRARTRDRSHCSVWRSAATCARSPPNAAPAAPRTSPHRRALATRPALLRPPSSPPPPSSLPQ